MSPWELVIRGSAMYLFLFALFRVGVKRRIAAIGMADPRQVKKAFIEPDGQVTVIKKNSYAPSACFIPAVMAWRVFQ